MLPKKGAIMVMNTFFARIWQFRSVAEAKFPTFF